MPALHQKPPTVVWASCPNEQKLIATPAGIMPALHQKPPTVVWASCPNEQKLIATLAGRMPVIHKKPPTVAWASLPERIKTSCNTGGQNVRNTSKTTDGSVGIPARTNKKLVVTPAGRMPALHQKPPMVAWASCPNEQKLIATPAGRMPAIHKNHRR